VCALLGILENNGRSLLCTTTVVHDRAVFVQAIKILHFYHEILFKWSMFLVHMNDVHRKIYKLLNFKNMVKNLTCCKSLFITYTYACSGREKLYTKQTVKNKVILTAKQNFSAIFVESECSDNLKCYIVNVVHASSIVRSSQIGMDTWLLHLCFFAF